MAICRRISRRLSASRVSARWRTDSIWTSACVEEKASDRVSLCCEVTAARRWETVSSWLIWVPLRVMVDAAAVTPLKRVGGGRRIGHQLAIVVIIMCAEHRRR